MPPMHTSSAPLPRHELPLGLQFPRPPPLDQAVLIPQQLRGQSNLLIQREQRRFRWLLLVANHRQLCSCPCSHEVVRTRHCFTNPKVLVHERLSAWGIPSDAHNLGLDSKNLGKKRVTLAKMVSANFQGLIRKGFDFLEQPLPRQYRRQPGQCASELDSMVRLRPKGRNGISPDLLCWTEIPYRTPPGCQIGSSREGVRVVDLSLESVSLLDGRPNMTIPPWPSSRVSRYGPICAPPTGSSEGRGNTSSKSRRQSLVRASALDWRKSRFSTASRI